MGSNDTPPAHVPSYVIPIATIIVGVSWVLWTTCYILIARESFKTKTYGMPLLAMCSNLGWELVYAYYAYLSGANLECMAFAIWLLVDVYLLKGFLKYGENEWKHAPIVKKNLGSIMIGLTFWFVVGHLAFGSWWINEGIRMKEGKWFLGVEGTDATELGFWSALFAQVILSIASLSQLIVRQHTRGVTWGIWISRFIGTLVGIHLHYGWLWYMWSEANDQFMNPFAIFLWGSCLVCDLIYPFVFGAIRQSELNMKEKTSGIKGKKA